MSIKVYYAPEPGFEPESEAPQASRISKLPHSGLGANTTIPAMVEHSDANYFFVSAFIIYFLYSDHQTRFLSPDVLNN